MSATDEFVANAQRYAASFDMGSLPIPPAKGVVALEAFPDAEADVRQSIAGIQASPFIPHKDQVRGFVYDVTTGRLNEVGALAAAG